MPRSPRIGVLALQGDVREHLRALAALGVEAVAVRRPGELAAVDGLVLPGGESTTIVRLARTFELLEPLRERVAGGLPVLGTCAGMILLADRILDGAAGQETHRRARRDRAPQRLRAPGRLLRGPPSTSSGSTTRCTRVFIRAPWVEEAGAEVEVLARVEVPGGTDRIVAVRQGALVATSFHPEVGGDPRVHGLFVDLVAQAR